MADFIDLSEYMGDKAPEEFETVEPGAGMPEPGSYIGPVVGVDTTPSKKEGKPMITLEVAIETNADGSDTDQAGKHVFTRYVIQPPVEGKKHSDFPLRKLKTIMEACGLGEYFGKAFDPDLFLDTRFAFDVVGTTYKHVNEETMEAEERKSYEVRNERAIEASEGEQSEEAAEEETEEAPPPKAAKPAPAKATAKPPLKAPTPPPKGGKNNSAAKGKVQPRR